MSYNSAQIACAQAIIAAGKQRRLNSAQIIACLATAIQESDLDESAVSPNGAWVGVYQQDSGYQNRGTLQGNINGFFDRLMTKLASPGASPDIWKNIFWLQQRPGEASADAAYANGRQAYLTEIQSRTSEAVNLYNQLAGAPAPPGIPQANVDLAMSIFKARIGNPYVYGGAWSPTDIHAGTDCSGMVGCILEALTKGPAMSWAHNVTTESWGYNYGADLAVPVGTVGPYGTVCVGDAQPGPAPTVYPPQIPADAAAVIYLMHGGGGENSHVMISVAGTTMETGGPHNDTGGVGKYASPNGPATATDDPEWTDIWVLPGPIVPAAAPAPAGPDYQVLTYEQLAGPRQADGYGHGWTQLGGKTVVDALAQMQTQLNTIAQKPTPVAPAVVPAVAPAVVPAPAPVPDGPAVGPSGWFGIAGVVLQGVFWLGQQYGHLLPTQWAAVVSAVLGIATALGIYHAPNNSVPDVPQPRETPAPEPPPPAAPTPVPTPVPAPVIAPPTISDALAQAAAQAAAEELAQAESQLEANQIQAIREKIKQTLGTK